MTIVFDSTFGNIHFDDDTGWIGSYVYPFLRSKVAVELNLGGEENENISSTQQDAFVLFDGNSVELCRQAEDAIFRHYQSRCKDLRGQFGDNADEYMPFIDNKTQLKSLVTPVALMVKESLTSTDRIIGLLFNCSWEPSLGLAVRFVNEVVREVGPQDIVL
ncbi:DUF6985 domain-containing protein [Collimonas arenae]|uniref:DUF6985 domain-containing protein n=1 Tax=Collimonas arenae TaxID=279058 RepID=UPI000690E488|nr:hypothetical protein [Collimonas arenae]